MSDAPGYTQVEGLAIHLNGGLLQLILRRPLKRNAIDDEMMLELIGAVEAAGTDESVRVVVVEGVGEHFCGGADIVARNERSDRKPRAGSIQRRLPTQAHRLIPLLCTVQVPVVCKVRGWAAGVGFQLALAADLCIAGDDARAVALADARAAPWPRACGPPCGYP